MRICDVVEPLQQAEAAVGHSVELPELQAEELTSQQDVSVGFIGTHGSNNKPRIETKDDIASDGLAGSVVQHPHGVTTDLGLIANESQEAFDSNRDESSVEKTDDFSSGEFVQHSVDTSVTIHSVASELKAEQDVHNDDNNNDEIPCSNAADVTLVTVKLDADTDVALEVESEAESPVTCSKNVSITGHRLVEQTENELVGVEKLPDNTELDTSKTGMSVMLSVYRDAEVETSSDFVVQSSSNQCVVDDADEMPVVTTESHLNITSSVVKCSEHAELLDEVDNRALCAELTCVRNVNTEAPCDLSNENVFSEATIGIVEDVGKEAELVDITSAVVNCSEHTELLDEADNRALCTELTCVRNVNIEAPCDLSNENVFSEATTGIVEDVGKEAELVDEYNRLTSRNVSTEAPADVSDETALSESCTDQVHESEALADTAENCESEYHVSDETDNNKELAEESNKTVSHSEVTGIVHVEAPTEVLSEQISYKADGAEISESTVERPYALLVLQPSASAPDSDSNASRESPRSIEDTDIVKLSSWTDPVLPFEAVQETEMCCTEGEEQSITVDSVVERDQELLKQAEAVEPVTEPEVILKQFNDVESVQESLELANTVEPIVDDGAVLKQFSSSVDSVIEDDRELVKESDNVESVVVETRDVLKTSINVKSVLERDEELLKQSETAERVAEDEGKLVEQYENAESVLEHVGDLPHLLEQPETVERVVEDDEELLKQYGSVELALKERGDLQKVSSTANSVLEHDTELLKQTEMVEKVIEGGGEFLEQLDTDDSVSEHNGKILKQLDDHGAALAQKRDQLKQPQYDEMMRQEIVVADEVVESTSTDGVTVCIEDVSVHLEPPEEHDAHVSAASDAAVDVPNEVTSAATGDSSPGDVLEMVTMVSIEHCVSPIMKEPEYTDSVLASVLVSESEPEALERSTVSVSALIPESEPVEGSVENISALVPVSVPEPESVEAYNIPVSAPVPVLVSEPEAVEGSTVNEYEPESEAAKEFTVPVSKLVPHTDRSNTDELELMVPEEQEMQTSPDVAADTDAGMPLEDLEIQPVLQSDLYDKHSQQDVRTVTSTDNSNAVVRFDEQVLASNTEVCIHTVEAIALSGIEGSETEAQAAVCHMKQREHETDACCTDLTVPSDIDATSSENAFHHADIISVADESMEVCAVHSENTAQSGVVISSVDKDAAVRSEDAVESVVISSVLVRDILVHACSSEDAVQNEVLISAADKDATLSAKSSEDAAQSAVMTSDDTLVHTESSEESVLSKLMISTTNEDPAVVRVSAEDMVKMVSEDEAICSKSLEHTVQSELIISMPEDTAAHTQSSEDTDQDGVTVSTADNDTATDAVSSESLTVSEGVIPVAEKDIVVHVSLPDMTVSRVETTLAHKDTSALVADSEDTDQREVLISMGDKDAPIPSAFSQNTEQSELVISAADTAVCTVCMNSEDMVQSRVLISTAAEDLNVHNRSLESPLQSGVMVSMTDNDKAVTATVVEDTVESGVTVSVADEDAIVVTKHCSGVDVTAECKKMTPVPSDIGTSVDQVQVDDVVADAVGQYDSQVSNSSVEEGQFDDVESDDNAVPATPMDSRGQLSYASPALRAGRLSVGHSTSFVPGVRRNLPPVGSSSFTLSPARTPNSRHSAGTYSVTNRSITSTLVQSMPGCSPLLSSPVGQNVNTVGRPGSRPRFPQSPILLHSGGYSSNAGLQIRDNSPRSSYGDEKPRKRKHSADDADVTSKRSLVADFVDNNTAAVCHYEMVPAECAVISSGCDTDNVTVTGIATVVDTSTHAAAAAAAMSEKLQDEDATHIVTSLSSSVCSLPCDNCSVTTDVLDAQTVESSICSKENVLAETEISVVDSIPSHREDTIQGGLLNNRSINSDAEETEKPGMVEIVEEGCALTKTEISVVDSIPSHREDAIQDGLLNDRSINSDAEEAEKPGMVENVEEGCALIKTEISVVDSIPSQREDAIQGGLLNDRSINSDAEESDKPGVVENVKAGYTLTKTEAFPSAVELVEGSGSNVVMTLDEMASNFYTLVADVAETVCGSHMDSAAENIELAAEHSSGNAAEVGHAASSLLLLVTTNSCHDQCISDLVEKQQEQESLKLEVTSEIQPCGSSIALTTVKTSSSDSCSLTAHEMEPVGCVTDIPRTDRELPESRSTDMERVPVDAVSPVSVENSSCVANSSVVTSSYSPCFAKPLYSQTAIFCTQDDIFSDNNATRPSLSDAADTLTTSYETDEYLFASQCVSQATDDISASQATVSSDVGDVSSSQCMSHVTKDELPTLCNQANTNSDVHGLHLFLESSQEPNALHTSFCSQYMSQETKNEGNEGCVSCSQTTVGSDVDGLHLYLEPSQEPNSLDALNHKKSHFTNSFKRYESEDDMPTDGENNQETASESELLMELRDRGVSSQSTAGGLDQSRETAGEEEEVAALDNLCGIHVQENDDCVPHGLREGHHRESELDNALQGCQQNAGAEEQMISGEGATGLETKDAVVDVRIESYITGEPCEMAVLDTHDNVDEFNAEERHVLSVIAEEESDSNVRERVTIDDEVTVKVTMSGDTSADKEVHVTELYEKVDACSPVKSDSHVVAIAAADDDVNDNDNKTSSDDDLDVTENIDSSTDKDADITQPSEKSAVCSPLKRDVCMVAAAAVDDEDNSDDGTGITESIPGFGCSADSDVCLPGDKANDDNECDTDGSDGTDSVSDIGSSADKDVDLAQLSDTAAVYSPVNYGPSEVATVDGDVGNPDDGDDDGDDGGDGSDGTDSISDIGRADKDVDLAQLSDKAAIYSPVNYGPSEVAAVDGDVGNPDDGDDDDDSDDDGGSDVTESLPDVGSDVGHLSDVEENVVSAQQQPALGSKANENFPVLSPRSLRRLLIKNPVSVADVQREELFAGKCC